MNILVSDGKRIKNFRKERKVRSVPIHVVKSYLMFTLGIPEKQINWPRQRHPGKFPRPENKRQY